MMLKPCEICGKKFEIRKSHYPLRKTCGRSCGSAYISITRSGENSPQWRGGRRLTSDGYSLIYLPNHPRSCQRAIKEHMVISEKILGKPLPLKSVIHHVDGIRTNNVPTNLVLCEDLSYHVLIHKRKRALSISGHADWLKCPYCGQYDSPSNMRVAPQRAYHRECQNKQKREKYLARHGVLRYPNKTSEQHRANISMAHLKRREIISATAKPMTEAAYKEEQDQLERNDDVGL